MAELIIERVKRGGQSAAMINPQRSAPNFSDLGNMVNAACVPSVAGRSSRAGRTGC